jgi:hypothetical protein
MTTSLSILLTLFLASSQDTHQHMNARGAEAMGFDQDQTIHHFRLHADGGAIQVNVKDVSDARNLAGIHEHLPHIAQRFSAGDFSMPHFIHAQNVPGSAEMKALKDAITYHYEKTKQGGRVRIITDNANALAAIHVFLRYQIVEHRTGDSLEVVRTP